MLHLPTSQALGRALLGGGGVVLDPSQIATGLKLWIKADAGVYSDAGTTPAGNNDTVRQANDQSGSGNNLSQGTAASRPTLLTNIQGGNRAILRGDSGDVLGGSDTAAFDFGTGDFTVAGVVKGTLWGTGNVVWIGNLQNSGQFNGFQIGIGTNGKYFAIMRVAGVNTTITDSAYRSEAWIALVVKRTSGVVTIHVNGTQVISGSAAGDISGDAIALFAERTSGTNKWGSGASSDIGEALVYDSALSAGQVAQVFSYLYSRWTLWNWGPVPASFTISDGVHTLRDPSNIIKVGSTYYVWFVWVSASMSAGFTGTIKYATATNLAGPWTIQGTALSAGSGGAWNDAGVFSPNIVFDGTNYHLFATGIKVGDVVATYPTKIGEWVSSSPDGPWTPNASNPIISPGTSGAYDDGQIDDGAPLVVNGQKRLYYKSVKVPISGSNMSLNYATPDTDSWSATSWTKKASGPILSTPNRENPTLFQYSGQYHMLLGSFNTDQFYHYTSPDGDTWTSYEAFYLQSAWMQDADHLHGAAPGIYLEGGTPTYQVSQVADATTIALITVPLAVL